MSTQYQKVQLVDIGSRNHDQRLDNFLLSQLKGVPKSRIYKLLRSGQVRVNKGRKKPSYRVQEGDQVRIPPVTMVEKPDSEAPAYMLEKISNAIIFEDDRLLVINKPTGIAVHSGSNVPYGVIEILRQLRPEADMLELVHRLDRETSGCLLIAKTRPALTKLHEIFRSDDDMQKTYRAILMGRWQGGERLIDVPLKKNQLKGGERIVTVDEAGKEARSLFTPLDYFERATSVEVKLFTGRTHQIRVHAAHEQHSIAGDPKYGDKNFNQYLKKHKFKRMFLHAYNLQFKLEKNYNITAPLDEQWEQLTKLLS
jgi:23S rRNA pseudouridine955/2504/2580 synthase